MKTLRFLLVVSLIISGSLARSQNKCLPDVDILTPEGKRVNAFANESTHLTFFAFTVTSSIFSTLTIKNPKP